MIAYFASLNLEENALEWVQRVHEPADLWDITFCTRRFRRIKFQKILQCSDAELIYTGPSQGLKIRRGS